MASLYFNRANVDFDDLFEPDSSGVTIPGFYEADGVTLLKYASVANGSKIADVEHYTSGGADVSTVWAGKGTVSYVKAMPDLGAYDSTLIMVVPINFATRMRASLELTMANDGTYKVVLYGTNFIDDTRVSNGQNVTNPADGVVMQSGQWLIKTGAGKGAGYTLETSIGNTEWGRTDYNVIPPTSWVYQANSYLGSLNTYTGTTEGIGSFSLDTTRVVKGILDMTPTGNNDNSSCKDKNGGFSRYWRGRINCRVLRNGVVMDTFVFSFHVQLRWTNTGDWTPGSGGGGGGSGGGGSCVVLDAEMFDGRMAGDYRLEDTILVTDPYALEGHSNSDYGTICYSEPALQPCVEVELSNGTTLKMSTTAPIPTQDHGFVLAPDLLGESVPAARREDVQRTRVHSAPQQDGTTERTTLNVPFEWVSVVAVRHIGLQWVSHLTVDHPQHCFWACSSGQWFILHHNLKPVGGVEQLPG